MGFESGEGTLEAPMTELISTRMAEWIPVFITLLGVCALIAQSRRGSEILPGPAPYVLAFAWPLWKLFQLLDGNYDTTSVVGMVIPYIVFIVIGVAVGLCFGRRERGGRALTEAAAPIEGAPADLTQSME